jgi:hypothetical protein
MSPNNVFGNYFNKHMEICISEIHKGLFNESGVNTDNVAEVLSIMLSSPMGVSNFIGVENAIRLAIKLASKIDRSELTELIRRYEQGDSAEK